MRIERKLVPVEDFAEWVERHDLTVEVVERAGRDVEHRFYAHLKTAEIKDGGCLISSYADGHTEEEALRNLPKVYSECALVLDANRITRRELVCPRFKGC